MSILPEKQSKKIFQLLKKQQKEENIFKIENDDFNDFDDENMKNSTKNISELSQNEQEIILKFSKINKQNFTEKVEENMKNITEIQQEKEEDFTEYHQKNHQNQQENQLNQKVVLVYQKLGLLLSRYRSGNLPKTLKVVPQLTNWDQILWLTNPDKWTPQATKEITKLFVNRLNGALLVKFLKEFVLEVIRQDLSENKKLNVHLYDCLKKCLFKPGYSY